MLDALEQHGGLQVYQEGSEAVMRDFRLISMDRLREVKDSAEASGVVIKPLTDSQWVDRLLTNIDGSRAVWMFRGWADVVNSSAVKWPGHGADIVAAFRRGDDRWLGWRSERIEPATRARFEALSAHCEDGDDHGAWAAWWWLRNQHFFDLILKPLLFCRLTDLFGDLLLKVREDAYGIPTLCHKESP